MNNTDTSNNSNNLKFVLSLILALGAFLWSLDLMTATFQLISNDTVQSLLDVTGNPFISLFIGLFITAVIQSSSTSTSLIVAIVASGSLSLQNAVPMIMGANIGTTLTSTIISLSYITNNKEFRNAIATGVMHDFFNILTVAVLFPLEWKYQILSGLSLSITDFFGIDNLSPRTPEGSEPHFLGRLNDYLINIVSHKSILIIISIITLFASIKLISKTITEKLIGTAQQKFESVFFKNSFNAFTLGTVMTSIIQSSSITTTIIVPLGATEKIKPSKIYPYIVGSNIGTTITALIAAFNKSEAALNIALVHFLFNLIGMFLFLIVPGLKKIPVIYARKFGLITSKNRVIGFLYILFIFFILPLSLIFLGRML
ncbi:MAG: Na/Pi symporter [Reichenbachiella sp.]